MSSFIKNGHEYHLYTYNDVVNVPDNVIIKDGNEILSKEKIFSYQSGEGRGSFSAFSNFFRYKLLSERGGWWADTDMICLRPFDFEEEYVFLCGYSAKRIGIDLSDNEYLIQDVDRFRKFLNDEMNFKWENNKKALYVLKSVLTKLN